VNAPASLPSTVYSVVLPVFNEEDNLPALYQRLTDVMQELGEPYELIFVDDGSKDGSAAYLAERHHDDPSAKLLRLSRNFGHQLAITAGLGYATGQAVIVMDSDLQDSPEDIPTLVGRWKEGFQVVYAVRESRKENLFKQLAYRAFYRILNRFADIDIPLDSGDFSLMDRRIVQELNRLPEKNRFIRGLRAWVGFQQIGVPVARSHRYAGKPKYEMRQLFHLALSGLMSFSVVPLRLATSMGFSVALGSFLSIAWVLYCRLFTTVSVPGFAATASILLFLGGVQLFTIGILGEYIGKIYDEVKRRPLYLVSQALGLKDPLN